MKKLDVYLADLMVLNVKFHNWHWNVEGFTFKAVHEYLEALYNDVFEKYDEIAEYQKMTGTCPNASLKEYLAITGVKEIESKKVTCEEAIVAAKKELEYLRDSALAIREEADDFVLSNKMEDHVEGYNKQIWFKDSMLKESCCK